MDIEFGEIKKLDLRHIWSHEAHDFTPWLANNIQQLGKILELDLELVGQEENFGDFNLDILAKDLGSGKTVIIENQLNQTDHDHLGKALTYAAGFNASIVIWIAKEIREEHRQTLDWLNQRTDSETQFFGVIVEVIKIGNSMPACQFRPVAFPNWWRKRTTLPAPTPRGEAYRNYFQKLIDTLREKHNFTNAKKGQPQSWYSFSSGISGILYGASFAQGGKARVELYIDTGDKAKNKKLFDSLKQDKMDIEQNFDIKLKWERLDDKRASRVAMYRKGSIESEPELLSEIHDWTVENLLRMRELFGKKLKNL